MSTKTLMQLVRDQILAEGPDFDIPVVGRDALDAYVDEQLNYMTHVELLERISNAHQELESRKHNGTPWL